MMLNNHEMLLRKDPSFQNFVTIKPTILLDFCFGEGIDIHLAIMCAHPLNKRKVLFHRTF